MERWITNLIHIFIRTQNVLVMRLFLLIKKLRVLACFHELLEFPRGRSSEFARTRAKIRGYI